jgi:nucleotide-binding universal stress UspA family protein
MPSVRKILLPVDFSERSLGATRYAQVLASHFQAEITLLHVLEPFRYEFSTLEFGGAVMSDLAANRSAQARKQLEAFLASELSGVSLQRVLLEGDPAQQIVQYAQTQQIDVITMPTHGYGPFRRFILGSVTAKVLHDADCPVWTGVHMEEAPASQSIAFRNILCALDFGPHSRRTLSWAAQMASEFGARLILVHAVPSIEVRAGEYFDQKLTAEVVGAARQELLSLQRDLNTQAELFVEGGDPPKVICRAAAQFHADLLVIGRGSAAGIFGRLRTNAYAIIRQSPCPVVSV